MSQPGKGFLVWLAGLSVLGFLATDMYLPAFAAMQQDLNTSAASISASIRVALCTHSIPRQPAAKIARPLSSTGLRP